jgi:hypothetical protein
LFGVAVGPSKLITAGEAVDPAKTELPDEIVVDPYFMVGSVAVLGETVSITVAYALYPEGTAAML